MDWKFVLEIAIRSVLAVLIGGIIGSERARHGRAAGMRTHILVCLGAALTSMTGVYLTDVLGYEGDAMRIAAQVVSGIGFLGVGMIVIKNNNVISGLTTAAGIWATSIIGIAIGCGFYAGALIVSVLLLLAIMLFARLERYKRRSEVIYIEIDNMYKTNSVINEINKLVGEGTVHKIIPAKSGNVQNIGVSFMVDRRLRFDSSRLLEIESVIYVDEED